MAFADLAGRGDGAEAEHCRRLLGRGVPGGHARHRKIGIADGLDLFDTGCCGQAIELAEELVEQVDRPFRPQAV